MGGMLQATPAGLQAPISAPPTPDVVGVQSEEGLDVKGGIVRRTPLSAGKPQYLG